MAKSSRITIPTKPGDLIGLAQTMEEKHKELAEESPLALLDWKTASPKVKEADEVNSKIEKLSLELEKLVQRRNNLAEYIAEFVRQGRDILSGVYRSEMKRLGDFGFQVDDSPKPKKTPATEKKA